MTEEIQAVLCIYLQSVIYNVLVIKLLGYVCTLNLCCCSNVNEEINYLYLHTKTGYFPFTHPVK